MDQAQELKKFQPAYLELAARGVLSERVAEAQAGLWSCTFCPKECRVDRTSQARGFCRTGARAVVASFSPHFGEEGPLVGKGGSGTIFFTHCNLLCLFCQNYEISHLGEGEEVTGETLAALMLKLQNRGCHNINFVSPSHVVPQILAALPRAISGGLRIPLVYNSGGYDSVSTLRLLEGIFDIYMPDFKFWHGETAEKFCGARDYPERARAAILEMHRQVGNLFINREGIAERGLLVRHLVLPGRLAGTTEIMRFLAREVSPHTYVNIMGQYHPCGRAREYPPMDRPLNRREYTDALQTGLKSGLERFDQRN